MLNWINQSPENFWTVFSAVFIAIGSIATFCAVIVALWQSRIAIREKLIVRFVPQSTVYISGIQYGKVASVDVINAGYSAVKICMIGLTVKGNKQLMVFPTPLRGEYNKRIERNDSECYLITDHNQLCIGFARDIKNGTFKISHTIYVEIGTANKSHKIKTKYKISDILGEKGIHEWLDSDTK